MKRFRHYLTYNGDVKELLRSPAGWRDSQRKFYRHNRYNSVFREDATEIRLVNFGETFDYGGYWWLKNYIDTYSPNIEVTYTRQRLDPYTQGYEPDYVGVLDLTPKSGYKEDKNYITVKTIDSSKLAKFIARDEIELNVLSNESIDGVAVSDFVTAPNVITIPKIDIYLNAFIDDSFSGSVSDYSGNLLEFDTLLNGVILDNEIGDRLTVNKPAESDVIYNNNLSYESELQIISLTGNSNDTLNLSGITASNTWTYRKTLYFVSYDSSDVVVDTYTRVIHEVSGSDNQTNRIFSTTFAISSTQITVPNGGYVKCYVHIFFNTGGTSPLISLSSSTGINNFQLQEFTEGAPNSSAKGFLLHELITRQLQLVTSETNTNKLLKSEITGRTNSEFRTYSSDGDISKLWLTSGEQLRGKDNPIYTTIQDTFTSINAMHPIGLGYDKVNDRFILEDVSEFYKDEAFSFTLDNVKVSKEFVDIYYWNQCLNGYPKVEVEDFQGANEYNTQSEHSSVFKTKSTYNIRSTHQGSSIDVEVLRRLGNTSKDSQNDDKKYILLTDGSNVVQNGATYTGFDGIEQYYNPGYTPRQNVIKHTKLLSAEFHNLATEKIRFQSNIKNNNISYSGTNEFDDIESSEFLTPLIYPEKYSFEAFVTYDFIEELRTDPHRYLIFSDGDDNIYYGYIMNLSFNVYTKKATFELLRANINR